MNVVVIGSGPGGYVAAIKCAQLGMQVSMIEKYKTLGGTCLNVGCIPSKALLDSSEHFHQAKHQFKAHGIEISEPIANIASMIARKNDVVAQNTKGIEFLMKKNKIKVIHGHASFVSKNSVEITKEDGTVETLSFDRCIIATGSKPVLPAQFGYDGVRIISSTEALNLKEIPQRMAIVGAGVIGLELGSVFARLGTKVTVLEYMERILPGMDLECAKELQKSLQQLGIEFLLGKAVQKINSDQAKTQIQYISKGKEEIETVEAEITLIAIGRRPYTEELGCERIGIEIDEKGRIKTNSNLETSVAGIYAIGDVVQGAMLAHKAEEEGVFVAEILAGQKPHIHYALIPGVVYTWPEFAAVGLTEEQCKEQQLKVRIGKFPFKALGRSRASMDTDGMVKLISDAATDELLGVHIVGARAADMIMEAVTAMEFRAGAEDLARISHPHPTYTEAIKEAAMEAAGMMAIHK
ncbi:MAG TPA: dihydrolipoyl dehydrogenase [Saprospiraceae bacterium]|nr:dihydrolipoyl dehydrogenase [Saprospiraceae bacterium]